MQITPEQIIFLLMVILSSQYRQAGAFRRSTAMCSSKRISCLSETSYRFCFQAGSTTYSYGRTKHCPQGTECDVLEGKYACVKNEKHVPSEFQSTPTSNPNLWITEIQDSSENNDISSVPIITVSPTIVPTTVPWTVSATSNPFVSLLGNHNTMFTEKKPELEKTTSIYTEENTSKETSSPLTLTPVPELNEITTRKIKRKKNPSKPKRRKKPTKLVVERKTTTVPSSTYHTSTIKNSPFSVKTRQPTTPLQQYPSASTTIYPSSKKPPKRRRKKPQKTPTQIPPTRTDKPPKKLKKKKKPQKTLTTSSVTQTTSASTTYLLPATLQINSTTTIAELSSVEPARFSPTMEMSSALSMPPATTFFEVSLATPQPCPYYLNILYSRSASTTTQTAVSLTPPSSCKTTGKYPSKNCHEYFECLKVMWWYRLMFMKCKKGEGFDATLLQCIPDETCV